MNGFRKWTDLLLAAAFLFLSACSAGRLVSETGDDPTLEKTKHTVEKPPFSVDSPMAVPQYIFDHEPTTDEMRAAAVDLMRKALSVQWYTTQEFETTTSVSHNVFKVKTLYAGLPYNGPNSSLYAFLEYLDPETGRLLDEDLTGGTGRGLADSFEQVLGSSCSGTAGWAILSVCNSVHGLFQSYYMVAQNGWLPLGNYSYDLSTPSFGRDDSTEKGTDLIVARNGEQTMYQSYALLMPGDIVVWQNDTKLGHTMMATSDAVVVKNADGTINGAESYVLIQDQRFGGYSQTDESSGRAYAAQGRVDYKYSFEQLFREWYLPMTTAEFQGQKAYTAPEVALAEGKTATTPADLNGAAVESNYPMATLALWAENRESGERTRLRLHCFSRAEIESGVAQSYDVSSFERALTHSNRMTKGSYRITVEVRTPNGQLFYPVDFDYTVQ